MSVEFNLHAVCLLSAGTVCFYPRRLGGSHLVWRDGGGGGSAAQVRGRAADPGACWEDASGQTVQGEQRLSTQLYICPLVGRVCVIIILYNTRMTLRAMCAMEYIFL